MSYINMGDFGEGIDQSNNMLSEMSQHNSALQEHLELRQGQMNEHLHSVEKGAREERGAQADPKLLGEDVSQFAQVGTKLSGAKGVLKDTYGDSKLAYMKGLGRTGEETTFGLKPLGQGAVKVAKTGYSALASSTSSFKPGAITSPADLEGIKQTQARIAQRTGGPGGEAPAEVSAREMGTKPTESYGEAPAEGDPITATRASGSVTVAADLEKGGMTAGDVVKGVGEVAGKAGVGLGILGGVESAAADITAGKIEGDNKMEKWGNMLSMAGGAADTIGLAAPPMAIVGGLLGIASAGAELIGHLEHAHDVTKAAKAAAGATTTVTPDNVASITSLGQVASRGTSELHSINPNGSF
jgi:hypothetical protein